MDNGVVVESVEVRELTNGSRVGTWRVGTLIGRGGTSAVYEVEHVGTGKPAALKVMLHDLTARARTAERFALEARVTQDVSHPAVPEVFEVGRLDDGRPYLVMELLQGRTLGEVIARGRTSVVRALVILEQLCGVLAAAHARGVIHRDLKPDNVIVLGGEDGTPVRVKLLDWGIAKMLEDHLPGSTLTCTGAIVGTPRYLSPEQARSQEVDARTDVYSLGLVAYELVLGVYPFETDSPGEALMMHMVQPPPSPRRYWPEIPPELERMLLAMLAKDPAHRPSLAQIAVRTRMLRKGSRSQAPIGVEMCAPVPEALSAHVDDSRSERITARCRRLSR
jgi:serine/threonine-protein kinase